MLIQIRRELNSLSNHSKAQSLQRYFKTAKGEYGEGDIFIGISVPMIRTVAKKYKDLPLEICLRFLHSPVHEERLLALLILVEAFCIGSPDRQKFIFDLYISNTKYINNWDLVDLSAPEIVGVFLFGKEQETIFQLAKSESVWERRIAIIATYYYIKKGKPQTTLAISRLLLNDNHDLIHKAVGWMLREVGKKSSIETEEQFLKKFYKKMPRTMLRYAIERFPKSKREAYLLGKL